ncbi:MAG: MYG1 family protein [Spirochaetes bacterium]|nr:MYG1 family protein [Spirochaetota bacterium]
MKIAVHNGKFHADDVFACAIARLIYPSCDIIRTRDEIELSAVDMRIDVGGKNNPASNDFDHHMKGGAGERTNGVPYAACGLMWKHFGKQITPNDFVWNYVDQKLIQTIDALDCGVVSQEARKIYSAADVFDSFNSTWNEEETDEKFFSIIDFAGQVIKNEIARAKSVLEAEQIVRDAVKEQAGKKYLVLPVFCPWQKIVSEETDFLYVIFPDKNNPSYRVRAVPVEDETFEVKKKFPEKWAGLRDAELALMCGIPDALFCHPALFIAGALTLEGAVAMAGKAAMA